MSFSFCPPIIWYICSFRWDGKKMQEKLSSMGLTLNCYSVIGILLPNTPSMEQGFLTVLPNKFPFFPHSEIFSTFYHSKIIVHTICHGSFHLNFCRYKLELHVIHLSSNGSIAVIGITYKYGHPDPFLAKVMRSVSLILFFLRLFGLHVCTPNYGTWYTTVLLPSTKLHGPPGIVT